MNKSYHVLKNNYICRNNLNDKTMIKTSIENLAEPIGFDIANSDDNVQGNLLNGLGRGFKTYREQDYNMQLCYLVEKLTPESMKFISDLSEYIKLKKANL